MPPEWKKESQRKAFAEALVKLGKERSDIVVVNADLSSSTKTIEFAKEFPERHFNFGIAEQNMMSTAAGLAASGKIVFASTFAVFGTGRVYDQIRQSIAYPKLNVKIIATHAGITVGGDGATHQITEDVALMRVLPNMTVIVPADATETAKVIKAVVDYDGPVYVRLGRADIPNVTGKKYNFEIGKANLLREGKDVTLIGAGVMVSKCLEAAEKLEKEGIDARVLNMSTIKPIDEKAILKAARETGAMVTAEEHNDVEGLGSAVAKVLVENLHIPMNKVGIPDTFGESGDSDELMEKYGLTVEAIVDGAKEAIKRKGVKKRRFWGKYAKEKKAKSVEKKNNRMKKTKKQKKSQKKKENKKKGGKK